MNAPGLALFSTLATMAGMVMFGYYYVRRCDPLAAGYLDNSNQVSIVGPGHGVTTAVLTKYGIRDCTKHQT